MSIPPPVSNSTGIEITAKFWVTQFVMYLVKPRFTVDGHLMTGAWNTPTFIPTPVGQHEVEVSFPFLVFSRAGKRRVTVAVGQDRCVKVSYRAPFLLPLPGRIRVS